MEKVTIAHQVTNPRFFHGDQEPAAEAFARALNETGWRAQRVGIESWSSGLPHGLALALERQAPASDWLDASGLVDDLRLVKSPAEQACLRQAARVSDAGAAAAVAAVRAGVSERHVAAESERAMIEAGGTYPGFGPFIRSTARLGEEHTTCTDFRLGEGDALFLELSGCVARYQCATRTADPCRPRSATDARDRGRVASGVRRGARRPQEWRPRPRRLCSLAGRRRSRGLVPLSPPSLRLRNRDRGPAKLERRQ
jgi:Xaa-Pro aminopeptidase